MATKKGKAKGIIGGILAAVIAVGALGGALHLINKKTHFITTDGNLPCVAGFTGLTNSNGVLTYTGSLEKFNDYKGEDGKATTVYSTKESGEFVTVTSPLDNVWPYNAIKTVKDEYNNSFTAFPKMYMSYTYNRAGYVDGISFANYKVNDSYFISDAYLKPDGSGEYGDYFYIGQYEGSGTKEKLASVASATPLVEVTRAEVRTAARAYGNAKTFYEGYQQLDLPMFNIFEYLVSMYYKTPDIQSVYGEEVTCTSVVTTGTTAPISSMNGWNTSTGAVKLLGIENMCDSATEFCDGINFEQNSIYYQSNPINYTDTIDKTSDVVIEFDRPTTSGKVELLMTGSTEKTQSITFPAYTSNSSEDFVDDGYWFNEEGSILFVGGSKNSIVDCRGLWAFDCSETADNSSDVGCGRLCKRDV